MHSNAGRKITVHQLAEICATSAAFKDGFDSKRKGNDYEYDKYNSAREQSCYERGRIFALYTQLQKEKVSRWVKGTLGKPGKERLVRAFYYGFLR